MRYLLFLIGILMNMAVFAQDKYEVSKDPENGSVVFKGPITFTDLQNEPSFTWFKQNAAYTANASAQEVLKAELPNYQLVVVMGTWCEDSQNLVPKLYSILPFPPEGVTMFGVDRSKDALNGEKARYGIEKVPTIIVFKDQKEVGRITEVVQRSIEEDLANIIKAK